MLKKIIIHILPVLLLCGLCNTSFAQLLSWEWAKTAECGGDDWATSIAIDHAGYIYMTGQYNCSEIVIGHDTLTNSSSYTTALFLAKYDQHGNVIWAKNEGVNYFGVANSVAVDDSGNVIMAGNYTAATITFGSFTLTSSGSSDMFLVKSDSSGNVIWAKGWGGASWDEANSIATDHSGNIYLTGGSNSYSATGKMAVIFIKFDVNGNIVWQKSTGGIENDWSNAVAVDTSGNAYVAGGFNSPYLVFDADTVNNANTVEAPFLAKYDAAGNLLWARSAQQHGPAWISAVVVDKMNRIYLTGDYEAAYIIFDNITLLNTGGEDMFLVKCDSMGTVLWARSGVGDSQDHVTSITCDAEQNVYIAGTFNSSSLTLDTTTLINNGYYDIFLACYTATGNMHWSKSVGAIDYEVAFTIAIDSLNSVYIAGEFKSPSLAFGSVILTNAYSSAGGDIYIAKLGKTSGLNELDNAASMNIYPDPATGYLTIQTGQKATIEICNLNGQLIETIRNDEDIITISLKNLRAGIYIIKMITTEGIAIRKFIKE